MTPYHKELIEVAIPLAAVGAVSSRKTCIRPINLTGPGFYFALAFQITCSKARVLQVTDKQVGDHVAEQAIVRGVA